MKIYVLSHTDADGYFSAALVEFFSKMYFNTFDVVHKSWTYGYNLPKIGGFSKKYDKVYIVDLIPDFDFMDSLIDEMGVENVIWCDHHEARDKEYEQHIKLDIPGVRTTGCDSAAIAVWKYFVAGCDATVTEPEWLRLISDYDTWNTDTKYWLNKTLPYSFYIRNNVSSPKSAYEYILTITVSMQALPVFNHILVSDDIGAGKCIQKFWDSIYEKEVSHGFERIMEFKEKTTDETKTYKAWIVNTQNRGSYMFTKFSKLNEYDIVIAYSFNGTVYKYSMYTFNKDIACNNLIAVVNDDTIEFCGHTDAAGAMSKTSMFDNI